MAGLRRRLASQIKKAIQRVKPVPIQLSEKEVAAQKDREDYYRQTLSLRKEVAERANAKRKKEQLMKYIMNGNQNKKNINIDLQTTDEWTKKEPQDRIKGPVRPQRLDPERLAPLY